jgi:hypothetical protein
MKAALPGWIIVLLLVVGAAIYWSNGDAPLPSLVSPEAPRLGADATGVGRLEPVRGLVQPTPRSITVEFRFVDAVTGGRIEGGRIFDVRGGVLGITDREGVLQVSSPPLNAMVFGADGYLTEHFFDRPAELKALVRSHVRQGYVEVLLEPDVLTLACQLRFVDLSGEVVDAVTFRLRSLAVPAPSAKSVPSVRINTGIVSPELRAAWSRHVLLSTIYRPDFNPELLHFGIQSQNETYRCSGVADMRFVAMGDYRVEAQSDALVCSRVFEVHDSLRGQPITIQMAEGAFVEGVVVGGDDPKPLADALVVASRDGKILISGETGQDGTFRVGPLADTSVRVEVRHRNYGPFVRENVRPGPNKFVYTLQPLPRHRVHGVVRNRPAGLPVQGAEVRLLGGLGVASKAKTDSQGQFALESTLIEPTLEIIASGFLDYGEMINANSELVSVELIPDKPEARRVAGLSAIVRGRVVDSQKRPVRDYPVRVESEIPWVPSGLPGRRIIRGGVVPMQAFALTKADGTYLIEWPRGEAIRVFVGQGQPGAVGRSVMTTLGGMYEVNFSNR